MHTSLSGRHQKIEDSVSSTNPVDGRLDVFNLLGDHGRVMMLEKIRRIARIAVASPE